MKKAIKLVRNILARASGSAVLTLVGGAIILAPRASLAFATLTIDDTDPNEMITITWSGFDVSFALNGVPQASSGSQSVPETAVSAVSFSGNWLTPAPFEEGDRTIYLVEADSPNIISDRLRLQWIVNDVPDQGAVLSGGFLSDGEGGLGTLPTGVSPNDVFLEGTAVTFTLPGFQGQVQSDTDSVPETGPGAAGLITLLALCAFGLRSARCPGSSGKPSAGSALSVPSLH